MKSKNTKYSVIKVILFPNRVRMCTVMTTLFLTSFVGFGQNNSKKQLTPIDYHLWSSLKVERLSENAKWISFSLYYENGNDTLFVKSTKGAPTYSFPKASKGTFSGDRWFLAMNPKAELKILNLLTSKQETLEGIIKYDLKEDEVIILTKKQDGKKQLLIRNLRTNKTILLNNIDNYWYNPKSGSIVYSAKSENIATIAIIDLRDKRINTITSSSDTAGYSDIAWQDNGNSIAFLEQPVDRKTKRTCIGYYKISEQKLFVFNPAFQEDFPADTEIMSSSFANLQIAQDGQRVFFGLQKISTPSDITQVQIWNTSDTFIYPSKVQIDNWDKIPKVAVWWPEQNRFRCITDNEFPHLMLTGDQKQALFFNPQRYEPQANYDGNLDFYISELSTGKRKLVLENQSGNSQWTSVSPAGKYVVYFKNKHWWVYDILTGLHRNLTKELGVSFSDNESDWPEEASPYGHPGWTDGDKTLFVYDKYDIWSIANDGSTAFRLTNGRENQTTYRIVSRSKDESMKMNYDGTCKELIGANDRLLTKIESLEHTGYCFWDKKNGLQPLLDKKMHTSQFIASQRNEAHVYVEENFNAPPRLLFKENRNAKERVLFQSNPQHFKYNWGTSKLITYANSKGTVLNGILYYPANYDADKKYPMIVHLYEKQSKELYNYVNPSVNNPAGFNIANFTSKGYFVFLPDIAYEIGNPGSSAVDCVVSATRKVIACEPVDSSLIGLIGHSFGGYETDYIITQTNMFKTAVAGAAITDYVSGYLYVSDMQRPNFWHYEFGQLRMGKSLYENYTEYLQNSPIYHAEKVHTPLLSWAGEQDYHVHYYQSIEFHLALRRLGKVNTMLIYPGENHVLMEEKNQRDLTERIEQWFDYYLKRVKKPK
ncbi:S9 family peptidase [Flavobacterium sp.]|uniref:S9 family peptidase n=1 Tax=Flavobacterium sp. TaxID=239 RepID=UPI003D6C58F4